MRDDDQDLGSSIEAAKGDVGVLAQVPTKALFKTDIDALPGTSLYAAPLQPPSL